MPKYMRVKYTTATLDKMAEIGAAVWNLAIEFMQTVAVPKDPTKSSVTIVFGYHPHREWVSIGAIWESYGVSREW